MQKQSAQQLANRIAGYQSLSDANLRSLNNDLKQFVVTEPDQVDELFQQICLFEPDQLNAVQSIVTGLMVMINARLKSQINAEDSAEIGAPGPATLSRLFTASEPESRLRFQILRLLAFIGTDESLTKFVELICEHPPQSDADVLEVFEPLFSARNYHSEPLFPKLFELLEYPKAASAVVDLANYMFRSFIARKHPAAGRLPIMQSLLGSLCQRLEIVEENPTKQSMDPTQIASVVADSTALIVALCDLLALCRTEESNDDAMEDGQSRGGSPNADSIRVLKKAIELKHRRIRAEASAALVRLGDESGKSMLIELAGDASVRLRVLKYAQELSLLDEIEPALQSEDAIAESRLAMWLAQPRQMGVPPTSCELLDCRTQYWPGYDEPVECRLFLFSYSLGEAVYQNVGIVGPMTHAFTGNLKDLPVSQMYSAFAGWQTEHDEILQFRISELNPHYQTDVQRLTRRLHDGGFEQIEPELFGVFFGQPVLAASAIYEDRAGFAVIDPDSEIWLPIKECPNPITVEEAWCVYQGQQLLHAFN